MKYYAHITMHKSTVYRNKNLAGHQ